MTAEILSRDDLSFLLHDWLRVEELTDHAPFAEHSRDTFDAMLDASRELAVTSFRPHMRASDLDEPTFTSRDGSVHTHEAIAPALRAFADSGLAAASFGEEHGGVDLPLTVSRACFAWVQAANIATAAYPMLTMANAALIIAHGSPQQVTDYADPQLAGVFSGTMCLSEPHAGSSLADVTTRARRDDDSGTWRLTGTKMWISGGDHQMTDNIIHLVLARTGAAGVKGLSLFIVPKVLKDGERNDVTLAGLNHKMGYRGTTNTLLNFGDGTHSPGGSAGAVGYLVGEENRGLQYMFHMMNEARIGVGTGAAALAMTGYLESLDYARNRPQGRPVGAKDPARPQVPIIEHADVRRMLLAQKAYAEGSMALCLYAANLVDRSTVASGEQRRRFDLLLDVLTPVVKSFPSQYGPAANDLAIQVLGGAGYTRDHNVEQFYRDNRLNPIHEGTHGIQGQDLLGRKVVMQDGAGLRLLAETITATVDAAAASFPAFSDALAARLARLVEVTATLRKDGDASAALAHATDYLEVTGHVVVAWIWLDMAHAAREAGSPLAAGKRAAAEYFFTRELPLVDPVLDRLAHPDSLFTGLDCADL
ncbi:MAG: acyl-CoA dehydrogenase [Corynebacterium sp.]|uniref:acyl-CoA dehydrogenase n=1 Tax=unclassified Corynebacterium TaxID=2624378 RepID=UPI002649D6C7|nr:acyl-CoA dehydrogenase [Corynebacterium sp.]MDN5581429.1 acyl-CoA dehydrogenase [Corynebacterium sp.]MDN5718554.1 acyl-CoA dehydrogenase [Corynebacterium sp.]MDN6324276.1 acyl-CoA dehydrogenase [Corynebacterium sp.]MDN6509229.1 acyl-CoA dehydrogenase [Corynebacterium sp.]